MDFIRKHTNTIYGLMIFLALMPFMSPAIALLIGIFLSLFNITHPTARNYISLTLQASIVLMGFGMRLTQVIQASKTGFVHTAVSVVFVMLSGYILTKLFKIDTKTGALISAGTAICGGSAIAAVSPVIQAKNHQISFALIVVFVLNAVALFLFPVIGHHFHMSQESFGNWAAIAIHDTSSVVGAGAIYGEKALEVATTVKLIRALWIIPVSLLMALLQKNKTQGKIKISWFIGLFVISILLAYLFPDFSQTFSHLYWLGKRGMVVSLFLIGSGISVSEIKQAGLKSFLMGVLLWVMVGVSSFLVLRFLG